MNMKHDASKQSDMIGSFFPGFGRKLNVGIVLGYSGYSIVTARPDSEKNYDIASWGRGSYGEGITRKSEEFPDILKKILKKYLGNSRRSDIWCTIQSKGVETRFLVVPDAPLKHLPKTVFWAFKKEVNLSQEDSVFDYDVIGSRLSKDKKEIEILACSAPVSELNNIKNIFSKTGYPLAGITVTSFAFQNLFRTGFSGEGSKNIGTLFIGTDWSRIDIFSKGNLILSRDIKTGTRSMEEVLGEQVAVSSETVIDMDRYMAEIEKTGDENTPADDQVEQQAPEATKVQQNILELIRCGTIEDRERIFHQIIPVVNRLIRQIERTFEHFSMTTGGEKVERIYFTGPLCSFKRLLSYTGEQLAIPVLTINPFPHEDHGDISELDDLVPATGLALSDNSHTLNFNYTFRDKENRKNNRMISWVLVLLIFGTLVAALLFHRLTLIRESGHSAVIKHLTEDLTIKEQAYGQAAVLALSDRVIDGHKQLKKIKKKAWGAAILSEVSRVTPGHIRLSSFMFEEDQAAAGTARVEICGVVSGQPLKAKSDHDAWMESLKGLNGVKQVAVTFTGQATVDDQQVFYFETGMDVYVKP